MSRLGDPSLRAKVSLFLAVLALSGSVSPSTTKAAFCSRNNFDLRRNKNSETFKKNTKGGWREGGRRERPSASKRLTIEEAISKDFLDKDHLHCLKNMAQNARGAFLLCEGFLKGGFLKIFKNFQTSQT